LNKGGSLASQSLNANLAGEFAKDIGEVGGENLNEQHVKGRLVPGQDLHNLLQLVRARQVGQDGVRTPI